MEKQTVNFSDVSNASNPYSSTPSAITDGVAVPAWATKAQLVAHVTSKTSTPTVPLAWKAKRRKSEEWVGIPTASIATIIGRDDDLWAIEVECALWGRICPYVTGESGTFNMELSVTFTE